MRPVPKPHSGPHGAYTRGYLPHFDYQGVLQSVTLHLADALPIAAVHGVERRELDDQLGRGYGSCLLRVPEVAGIVVGALHYFHPMRYALGPWVVMPNHVHVVLWPREGYGLGAIMHSWKSYTAKQINALTGRTGPLWQREYFDRVVRNGRHLATVARYFHENPVAAGLVARAEEWPWSSAGNPSYLAALAKER